MKQRALWGTMAPFFERGHVLGRTVANASFLSELLRQDPFEGYHFFLLQAEDKRYLQATLEQQYPKMWQEGRFRLAPWGDLASSLQNYDYACFHMAEWGHSTVDLALLRNAYSKNIFPITAPVHTLGYFAYGATLLRHLWAGTASRDRLVVTSTTSGKAVEKYLTQLRKGYGLPQEGFTAPALQHIPLGVDAAKFAPPGVKKDAGLALRQELGLADEVVFLSFSRISYLSKMDFFPILDAFKRAEALGLAPDTYRFVLAGRSDAGDPSGQVLAKMAGEMGIPFTLIPFPDHPDDARRKALFAAADVFVSPTDTILETFGLTLLEAGAASLPVIASAIDGYKDLVRHGATGYLIPTLGPSWAQDSTRQSALLPADMYHLRLAQQCVVELAPFAEALARLGNDAPLRQSMGAQGYAQATGRFAWEAIVQEYIGLWDNLAAKPLLAGEKARLRHAAHPSAPDYLRIFEEHYSHTLASPAQQQRLVRISAKGKSLQANTCPLVVYEMISPLIDKRMLGRMLEAAHAPLALGQLAALFALPDTQGDRDFLLLWALKHDLLEFVE